MFKAYSLSALTLCLAACSAPEAVNISGSSTVLPAVSLAADSYVAETGTAIIVNAGGSGSGFNQLAEGQTDIGMMSRNITASELERFSELEFTSTAIGRDAVVPSISSEIYEAGVTALTLPQIADIYAGRVGNWSVFGGPDRAIFAIDKEASRGTRQIFMFVVTGDSKAKATGADLVTGSNNEEQTALTQSDSAIGMLSFAWLNEEVRGLSVIMPNGQIIEPSLENVRNGSFPFVRDLTVVTRDDIKPAAQKFVDYLLGPDGQKAVEASGYIRVTE
ncbi:substrate-binding domain-containing protein [Hellea balneolensis]|uniref:substrate-binding domain-containing protein n=1 Tax=Hellea balneolensis TaxID=287478 RepID=UPI0003FF8F90|nr:substrate-binding domain-containing protein [Hellea balneolensis]